MAWTRLRQVALVARDLDAVLGDLHATFGLAVAHRDPAVAAFGLVNAVLPIGDHLLEVVSPTREGTTAGRLLDRRGGDGGYMVIGHTDDHDAVRRRVDELGVRTVIDAEDHGYRIYQLHPKDTGGSFLEIDFQPGGEDPAGAWMPAGDDWQRARRTDVVDGIAGVTVECVDPQAVAARWSAITGLPLDGDVLTFDLGTTCRFVPAADPARGDGLVGIALRAVDRDRALAAASTRGSVGADGAIRLCGVAVTLV